MTEGRADRILARLRAEGGRVTVTRRAVVDALVQGPSHVTAEELGADVVARHPEIAQSTVYRILGDLERLGIVDHVHLGHGPAVYHLADDRHNHLVCERCGSVVEVPAAAFSGLARALKRDYGFALRARHFAVAGRCASCTTR